MVRTPWRLKQLCKHFLAGMALCLATIATPQPPQAVRREPVPATSATRDHAQALWEQAIKAKGGRERLCAVESVVVMWYGRGLFTGRRLRGVVLYAFPDRLWWWWDQRPTKLGTDVRSYDAARRPNPEDSLDLLSEQLQDFMETRWLKPEPLWVERATVRGKSADMIHTREGDEYLADFYIDPETHLPERVVVFARSRREENLGDFYRCHEARLDDYAPIQGIQMPRMVALWSSGLSPAVYQINVRYDREVFERKPRFEDGPFAWEEKKPGVPRDVPAAP